MSVRRDWPWVVIYVVASLLQLPRAMSFDFVALSETGSVLVIPGLMDQGLMPQRDFGYQYGLLTIVFGNAWLKVLGDAPWAIEAAILLADAMIVLGVARIANTLNAPWQGRAVAMAFLPSLLHIGVPNFCHLIDSTLVVWSLERISVRDLGTALALATIAVFVKPSMGFFIGLALILQVGWQAWQEPNWALRIPFFVRKLLPATASAVVCLAASIGSFGSSIALGAIFPSEGIRKSYKLHNFGFLNAGADFWRPSGARIGYYLGTPAGFWIAASLTLLVGCIWIWGRQARSKKLLDAADNSNAAILASTCLFLHLSFVGLFFGGAWSWPYYVCLLPVGLLALSVTLPKWQPVFWGMAMLALLSNKADVQAGIRTWRTTERDSQTAGLWASPTDYADWGEVRSRMEPQRVTFLCEAGGIEHIFPEFLKPSTYQLLAGYELPSDIARKLAQIRSSNHVLMRAKGNLLKFQPEFDAELRASFRQVYAGDSLILYERIQNADATERPAID